MTTPSVPRRRLGRTVGTVAAAVIGIAFAFPLLWVLTSSLRPGNDIFSYLSPLSIGSFLPIHADPASYGALVHSDFGRAILNSIVVSLVTVVFGLLFSAMAAFGLSAIKFRGQGVLFGIVVLSFLIPFDAISIPLADLFRDVNLQNTYLGLILPGIGNGLAIFLMRQFFLAIPTEIVEAARMDGLGWWGVFTRIYLPLSKPTLVGAGMTLFLFQWQAYMWPLLIGTEPSKQLAPIALANMRGQFTVDFGQVFAGSLVLTVIPLVLILVFQRHYTQSLASTGTKD
ncbi:carbohydrate ABC transporter permease [Actinocatenispora rupis]|uniref:sn-glycerol-3-phosphate transport system permease protein UgpE n=1 Tax=Actinocatenispora rupis TaxID=519421 RepID=A0A8J3NEQ5_9ACTN|nr:carbohydrate ABC transporter permease [Actinocatenispora rupis]GID12854.1 sn-glycerol-3-phosphate transport system permease protein UgpE [Actinocatenispora rupis]